MPDRRRDRRIPSPLVCSAVSKTVSGFCVRRGFKSLPLRSSARTPSGQPILFERNDVERAYPTAVAALEANEESLVFGAVEADHLADASIGDADTVMPCDWSRAPGGRRS